MVVNPLGDLPKWYSVGLVLIPTILGQSSQFTAQT